MTCEIRCVKSRLKTYKKVGLTTKNYPTVQELLCFKICMGIIRTKIEEHLQTNSIVKEQQFGFTKKRRTTDSIYALTYAIQHSKKYNYNLIITSIDFKKAFDSINRNKLLEAMKRYKLHTKIIDIIINIYNNEKTILTRDKEIIDEI